VSEKEVVMLPYLLRSAALTIGVVGLGLGAVTAVAVVLTGNATGTGWVLIAVGVVLFYAGWKLTHRSMVAAGLCCALATAALSIGVALVRG
jgi:hypothetical protein